MSILCRLETIESPLTACLCPRGVAGRLHTVRLRRWFRSQHTSSSQTRIRPIHGQSKRRILFQSTGASRPEGLLLSHSSQSHPRQWATISTGIRFVHEGQATRAAAATKEFVNTDRLSSHDEDETDLMIDQIEWDPVPEFEGTTDGGQAPSRAPRTSEIVTPQRWLEAAERMKLLQYSGDLPRTILHESTELKNYYDQHPDEALIAALKINNPRLIFKATVKLLEQTRTTQNTKGQAEFIRTMPKTTFSELLRGLDPGYLLGRYNKLFKDTSPFRMAHLDLIDEKTHHERSAAVFMAYIVLLIEERHRGPHKLALPDYKHLLKCARLSGDVPTSEILWRGMIAHGITPDLDCYNHYLATKCMSDLLHPSSRQKVHVDAKYVARLREKRRANPNFEWGVRWGRSGLRIPALRLFNSMMEQGIVGDAETFSFLMIASARDGDIDEVTQILRRVWGIEVSSIMNAESPDEEPEPTYPISPGSPTHPSELLLFAIAHCYGINNQMPIAIRLVEYVSRHFGIEITEDVWEELMERVYVLSHPMAFRQKRMIDRGIQPGHRDTMIQLFSTMTSPPYNVQPTISHYNRLIQHCRFTERFGRMQSFMKEAHSIVYQDRVKFQKSQRSLERHLTKYGSHPLDTELEHHLAEFRYCNMRLRTDRLTFSRWVDRLIHHGSVKMERSQAFTAINIPWILERFNAFVPDVVSYKTITGIVVLRIRGESNLDEVDGNSIDDEHSGNKEQGLADDDDDSYF